MKSWFKKSKLIISELQKGKSLGRSLTNIECSKYTLKGKVIDLGSKSMSPSYYRFFQNDGAIIEYTDINPETPGVIPLDLEKEFPVDSESYDQIIFCNVLEHLYNFKGCIRESFRILKNNGILIGSVPFIHPVHYDPDDFYRYTESSLIKVFKEVGYINIKIIPIGYGPVTTAYSIIEPITFRAIKIFLSIAAIGLDKALERIFKNSQRVGPDNYPLHYFFVCQK